jgi:hypothetical protein
MFIVRCRELIVIDFGVATARLFNREWSSPETGHMPWQWECSPRSIGVDVASKIIIGAIEHYAKKTCNPCCF